MLRSRKLVVWKWLHSVANYASLDGERRTWERADGILGAELFESYPDNTADVRRGPVPEDAGACESHMR